MWGRQSCLPGLAAPPSARLNNMPSFEVKTPQQNYQAVVERGILSHVADYVPAKAGKVFVVTTEDVWSHQGKALKTGRPHDTLFLPGGESHKKLTHVESMAEE